MRNFKLTIEYDGTHFYGWQIQPDRPTVQGELYSALEDLAAGEVKLVGAGRTDAGVHAVGQVASAGLETDLNPAVLRRALNAKLPPDILIRHVEDVRPSFNARFDAKSRTYNYIFIRRQSAIWRNYYHRIPEDLDLRSMRAALHELIGERDFTSFASSSDSCSTKRCNVIRADLIDASPLLVLEIEADHFLHNMVRSLAGTLLEIGRGKPWSVGEIIEARDRSRAGPTLAPYALYLMEVSY